MHLICDEDENEDDRNDYSVKKCRVISNNEETPTSFPFVLVI